MCSSAACPLRRTRCAGRSSKASIVLVKGTEGTEELKKEIQNYVKQHTGG